MHKYLKKKSAKKAGKPPGSLIYIGDKSGENIHLSLIQYNDESFTIADYNSFEECLKNMDFSKKIWINVNGIHNVDLIEKIGNHFNLHPLLLEDILNTDQRPKIDEYEDHKNDFIVVKMFYKNDLELHTEQVSFIMGPNYIISLQEIEGDVFNGVRDRLRSGKGKIRKRNIDYLTYALIDSIVDNYFVILEDIGERLELIEDKIIQNYSKTSLHDLHHLKRDLIILRKSVWPLREVIAKMEKGDLILFEKQTRIFIRDLYDHTIQVMDSIETFRDVVSGLHDMHLSNISNRMNEVMKTLTIIATIFIPLTFIVGVYGMNFEFMPELHHPYGYFIVWIIMIMLGLFMVGYFKYRKWL